MALGIKMYLELQWAAVLTLFRHIKQQINDMLRQSKSIFKSMRVDRNMECMTDATGEMHCRSGEGAGWQLLPDENLDGAKLWPGHYQFLFVDRMSTRTNEMKSCWPLPDISMVLKLKMQLKLNMFLTCFTGDIFSSFSVTIALDDYVK